MNQISFESDSLEAQPLETLDFTDVFIFRENKSQHDVAGAWRGSARRSEKQVRDD